MLQMREKETMTQSFEEELDEILKQTWRRGHTEALVWEHTQGMTIKDAKQAILSLIRERVPGEKNYIIGQPEITGWNRYRTELLNRLGLKWPS